MDYKIKERVLKIVQKVCVKTYQYAINQAYLDRQRHDEDKEWEKAMNAEREGTLENALSQSKRFGLSQAKAKTIISSVQALTNEWISYFTKAGVPDTDIETLKGIIPL